MEVKEERKKCVCCRTMKPQNDYLKKQRILKSCSACRQRSSIQRKKSLCKHDKAKANCTICGGNSICLHNKQRAFCIECSGSCICIHSKQKRQCKICTDPVIVTLTNMISNSRHKDRKYNRYDPDHHIDKCFIKGLIEDFKKCYYEDCRAEFQFTEYNDTLCTIERINNLVGHIKSNCVLACMKCNKSKRSNRTTPENVNKNPFMYPLKRPIPGC